jgi:hypothetical protein
MEKMELIKIAVQLIYKLEENYSWGEKPDADNMIEELKKLEDIGLLGESAHQPIPEIIISEEDCELWNEGENRESNIHFDKEPEIDFSKFDNIFDLLGIYNYDNPTVEGKIILYEKCIMKFGQYFHSKIGGPILNLKESDCIHRVLEIVLWHELGHWVTHWMLDKDDKRWNSGTFIYNKSTFDLHEGLAELFTYYAITNTQKENLHYGLLFEFMQIGQSACYHKHHEILSHKNFSWENVLNAIQVLRKVEDRNQINLETFLSLLETGINTNLTI